MGKIKILVIAEAVSAAHPTRMWELVNSFDLDIYEVHFATSNSYFDLLEKSDFLKINFLTL